MKKLGFKLINATVVFSCSNPNKEFIEKIEQKVKEYFRIAAIFLFIVALSLTTYSQTLTKSETIYRNRGDIISADHIFENGELQKITIYFMGQNHKYQHITDIISIYTGNPTDFYKFLIKLEKFYSSQEPGTSTNIEGVHVSVDKLMGFKNLTLFNKDMTGYRIITLKKIGKIKSKLLDWVKEKDIKII